MTIWSSDIRSSEFLAVGIQELGKIKIVERNKEKKKSRPKNFITN